MHRPWHTWTWFVIIMVAVLSVGGRLTSHVLKLEQAAQKARLQVTSAQNKGLLLSRVRLSLWHMDTALAPLLAREAARPYSLYRPFVRTIVTDKTGNATTTYVRSPLLTQPEHVRLHFQCTVNGALSSPQNPTGMMCELALSQGIAQTTIDANARLLSDLQERVDWKTLLPQLPTEVITNNISNFLPDNRQLAGNSANQTQSEGNREELPQQGARRSPPRQVQQAKGPQYLNQEVQQRANVVRNYGQGIGNQQQLAANSKLTGRERVTRPIWVGSDLLLARRVVIDGTILIQGCWLDWPKIRDFLRQSMQHVLPNARLVPARGNDEDVEWTMVSLPVKIVMPEDQPAAMPTIGWFTPIKLSLATAWLFLLLAAAAVALLLRGVVALSERRAAFVSAVTHELRTPLTTFRMYSEMLSSGMVPEERQEEYVNTLNQEAERLTHLVDNVLAYARLERGAVERRKEQVSIRDLLDRVKPRLEERAAEVDHQINWTVEKGLVDVRVETDVRAVEQILFNLIDNGCKYGQSDVHEFAVTFQQESGSVRILVRDYGDGIPETQRGKLFRPFSKSADEAAHSAPGVGLGLALCRRLARDLGGNLMYQPSDSGTCFILELKS